jgi:hypothetical protein
MDISPIISPSVDRHELAKVLDEVGDDARFKAVAELGRKELASLYEAAVDNAPVTIDDYVPPGVPPMTEVIHDGKNSLALFTRFQKRFCRPAGETSSRELWGYNEQEMRFFTGPGYFVAYHPTEPLALQGGVVIDYQRVPADKPAGWPPILPNTARLSRFIYNGTVDVMRRVSGHVTIGRAMRGRQPMDAWFVLVRRDAPRNPGVSTTNA